MFEYNPEDMPDEKTFDPWGVGEYEAEIIESVSTTSKAGNNMLKLNFLVTNDNGGTTRIYDYIVAPSTLYKLDSLCKLFAINFDGTLDESLLIGKRLLVKLGVDKGNEKYPPKNKIDRYIKSLSATTSVAETPQKVDDDDIPF